MKSSFHGGTEEETHSTFLAQSGGLLKVMKAQLVRMVNMISMLNSVGTESRKKFGLFKTFNSAPDNSLHNILQ